VRSYLNPSTGMAPAPLRQADYNRVVIRLLGLVVTLSVIAAVYWTLPEYSNDRNGFYGPFWSLAGTLGVIGLPLAPFYFVWTDRRLVDPQDSYWHVGTAVLSLLVRGKWPASVSGAVLRSHFSGWAVKSFFLPLMMNYFTGDVGQLGTMLPGLGGSEDLNLYHFLYELSYTVDLLFCIVGYAVTLRLFDSHIRSTEPTVFGWVIALICYQPFYSVIGNAYLHYDDNIYWDNLASVVWLRDIWAAAIIAMLFIYSLATVSFGLRFSNLTYRGIITSGPYRYCKHPAYLSKNFSWWLISVPMVPEGHWYEGLRNCLVLGLVNLVYYLRARTEEKHLSKDPDYVAYALWMNEHSIMAWAGKLLPILQYKPPAVPVEIPGISPKPVRA
jgi:isoprenylcysteine carboxyl methyltransferase (ICMT) family protein YpbQ